MSLEVIDDFKDPNPDDQAPFRMPDNSAYGRMLRRWNKPKREGGENANGFEKFPMMLHRAVQHKSGKWVTSMPEPEFEGFRNEADWMRELQRVKKFNDSCQFIVKNEQEYEKLRANGEGWRDTPDEAMAWRNKLEKEVGNAAIETEVGARKMSPGAQPSTPRTSTCPRSRGLRCARTSTRRGERPAPLKGRPPWRPSGISSRTLSWTWASWDPERFRTRASLRSRSVAPIGS